MINIDTLGGSTTVQRDVFISLLSQTIFTLTSVPFSTASITFSVNGIKYVLGTNFSAVGVTVTWLNTPFVMAAGDEVEVTYFI